MVSETYNAINSREIAPLDGWMVESMTPTGGQMTVVVVNDDHQ